MKRILFLTICLAIGAATAQAQSVAMYSEVYNEKTSELLYKSWQSANGNTRKETPDGSVTIMRIDSMLMYKLNPANKTAIVLTLSQDSLPADMRKDMRGQTLTYQVIEENVDVEGYSCVYREVTQSLPDGSDVTDNHKEWYHAPLRTWIRIFWDPILGTGIRRNIKQGQQPAYLFEIPAGYKRMNMNPDDALNPLKTIRDALGGKVSAGASGEQQPKSSKGKSEQEQLIEALKMLGGGKK
jgi:hypothetical protein